jgi:hypothetical protein
VQTKGRLNFLEIRAFHRQPAAGAFENERTRNLGGGRLRKNELSAATFPKGSETGGERSSDDSGSDQEHCQHHDHRLIRPIHVAVTYCEPKVLQPERWHTLFIGHLLIPRELIRVKVTNC